MGAYAVATASSDDIHPRQRVVQNFLLIWIDASIDESTEDCQNTLAQLQSVVNDINIFTKRDEAIDFLDEFHGMKAFLIVEGTIGQQILPLVHDIPQLDAIYIFCDNKSEHEQWIKKWTKIKGVYTDMKLICEAVQLAAKQCNQDSIAVSFVPVSEEAFSQKLDQLEPSFMYTQIFKDILLEMEHNEQSVKNFVQFWRLHYNDNIVKLKDIAEFEQDYCPQSAITWYNRECFVYEMLNRSLRMLEADTIINMSCFIRDLHEQIQELHRNQVSNYHGKSFIVYRGQGLLKIDFEKLMKSKGGLMSFNNFLSTSTKRQVSLDFAEGASTNTNMLGILFEMTIDPSVSSTPFASVQDVSYFQTEEEILFSMHTIFRIGEINKIDNNNSLYQVNLQLIADDDQQLRTLTQSIREEVADETGWQRLECLLIKLGQFDKAEEMSNVLLEQTSDQDEQALYYNQLGFIKYHQTDYEKAIQYYEKELEIRQKTAPNHHSLATPYKSIGSVYVNIGKHSEAFSYYEKALEIYQKTSPENHPDSGTSYNNIGDMYLHMGQYSEALSYYEKAVEIFEKTLPAKYAHLAASYDNIGVVNNNMEEYEKALLSHEKALELRRKTRLPTHYDLGQSYNNIGLVYHNTGEYTKALSFHEKTREIFEKTLPPNHPLWATFYNNIGAAYFHMGEYPKALACFERTLDIGQGSVNPNHLIIQNAHIDIENCKNKL